MTTPIAMITGASRGIGRAVAIDLAEHGVDVALLARSADDLEATARACREHGRRALVIPTDVTKERALRDAVSRCVDELGGLDVLVNNAGVAGGDAMQDLELDTMRKVFAVNVEAVYALTRIALPHILERSGPRRGVVNIASISGLRSYGGGAVYCGSKHAVVGMTGALFEDVREHGLKVCAICPGFVRTDMPDTDKLDVDKMIQPEDVAATVRFVIDSPPTACPTQIILRPQRTPYL